MKYVDLELDSRLFKAIEKLGYTDTTPIQEQAFSPVVLGKDVAGLAQTGTGKTAAFLIPLIERILKAETQPEHERAFKDWKPFHCILILVPTRELADQIHENIQKLTSETSLKSYPLYGGTGYDKQKEALSSQLQFIVSTPGRLIDLYKEHFVDLKKVRGIVFDEADRMFDMGFKEDMKYILSRIERQRQFLVFSATLNFDVLNTAYQFGSEPVEINISKDVAKADNVKDAIFHLGQEEKPQHLISIIKKENPRQTIIFTNYKNNVDRIANFLTANQMPAMGISSLISQSQRNQVITKFKASNNQNILVATDVAARGLDINDVDLVINFEMPQDAESYVHRIGRTGRAGKEGQAFSLVSDKDVESLSRVEEYTKKKIEIGFLEDADLVKDFKPMPNEYSDSTYKKTFQASSGAHKQDRGPKKDRPKKEYSADGRPSNHYRKPLDGEKSTETLKKSDRFKSSDKEFKPSQPGQNKNLNRQGAHGDKTDYKFKNRAASNGQTAQSSHQPSKTASHAQRYVNKSSSASHGGAKKNESRRFRQSGDSKKNSNSVTVVTQVKNFFKRIFG